MPDLMARMEESSKIFIEHFKTPLIELLGGGSIITIEGVDDPLFKRLDMEFGIDYIYTDPTGKQKLIGNRVQYDIDWQTFTIRAEKFNKAKTEFAKRSEQDQENHYSVHCYFNKKTQKPMSFAIAKTKDIILMIDNTWCEKKHTGEKESVGNAGAWFWCVKWVGNLQVNLIAGEYETNFPVKFVENMS